MTNNVVVETQMMIRRPVAEVFTAFTDPRVTTKFWFTKSSGPLVAGETLKWEWEMYQVSVWVTVKEIVADKRISIEWGDPATSIDFEFTPLDEGNTYVVISNYGFNLEGDQLLKAVMDNTGGFTTVLDGLKAWLEQKIQLNLVGDKFKRKM